MSLSSGTRGALSEGLSWLAVAGMIAGCVVFYDDIKRFAADDLGLPTAAEMIALAQGEQRADAPVRTAAPGEVSLPIGRDGHYHADAEINGRTIAVLVDTGASMVALTYEDAEQAGIYVKPSDFTLRISTANGPGRAAPVRLGRVSIGDITVRDVEAAVIESGRLSKTLLGMSFLRRLSRAEMRSGTLTLAE